MRKAGYQWLKQEFGLTTLDYWITSTVLDRGAQRREVNEGVVSVFHRSHAWPGDHWTNHLEFALKREGLHLGLLRRLMPILPVKEVTDYIHTTPTGRFARTVWYLYEAFTGCRLEISDLTAGNYIPLLDPEIYVTATPRRISRQRINDNLLGTLEFAPMVRKGDVDFTAMNEALKKACKEIVDAFPASIYQRAIRYLYAKESKSSHEIERETPTSARAQRFVALLEQAWDRDFLTKDALIELQNVIVDPRFRNQGYRDELNEQIYVGEAIAPGHERIHYIGPKPKDTAMLMAHFLETARKLIADPLVPDLVTAAVIAYVFNYLHPFSDGNGRIHRFLMHHALAKRHFGKAGIILPISAVILNHPRDYDRALESFSQPLLRVIDYELDENLRLTVHRDSADDYRYIDATVLTEIFYEFARETINTELPAEVHYLQRHDACREQMRAIIDFPERHAELFVKLCLQNGGKLSKRKRQSAEFSELTDDEFKALESVITRCFPEVDRKRLSEDQ